MATLFAIGESFAILRFVSMAAWCLPPIHKIDTLCKQRLIAVVPVQLALFL
jgi:hypothetical protein